MPKSVADVGKKIKSGYLCKIKQKSAAKPVKWNRCSLWALTARAVEIAAGNFFVPFDSIHW